MSFVRDLRLAARVLTRSPGYALAFVLTLGLAIGLNTAIFSVVNGVLLRPLPYEDADRILYLRQPAELAGVPNASFSFIEIDDYRAESSTVDQFVEYGDWSFNVVGRGNPHRAVGGLVTSNYFDVLGLRAELGRTLTSGDDQAGAEPVVVLTHDYWQRAFGADPGVLGQTVKLTGTTSTVVGVLEPGTHYTGTRKQDFFVNYTTNDHYQGASMRDSRTHRMTDLFARLAPGIDVEAARTELSEINGRLHEQYPDAYPERLGYGLVITPWQEELTKEARPTFLVLMGTVVMVLLLACANVANLTLARLIRRERELSIRTALGAGIGIIRRQLLAENLVLALTGAAVGLVVSALGLSLLVDYADRFTVRTSEIGLDPVVLLFTILVAVSIAVFLAWMPTVTMGRTLSASLAGAAGGRSTGALSRRRMQRALVVGQLSLSFMLLIGAGLLVRSLLNLQRVDLGFETDSVLTLEAPAFFTQTSTEENRQIMDQTIDQVGHFPGVRSVAHSTWAPLKAPNLQPSVFEVLGREASGAASPMTLFNAISHRYFDAIGTEVVRGRAFTMDDRAEAEPVVIINESMARVYFPGENAIGQQIRWQNFGGQFSPWASIVGIAADTRGAGLALSGVHTVYQPSSQSFAGQTVIVRSRGESGPLARQITQVIRELDPERPVDNVSSMSELMREEIAPQRLNATLFSSFAMLALVIAAVGVLGVLGFSVSQRTNEFGIRMALGARPESVLQMVLREGAVLAIVALALGGVLALLLSRFLVGFLYQVEPTDPMTYALVGVTLAIVAIGASLAPARRATRVDPMVALRAE